MAEEGATETQTKKSQSDEKDKIIAALLTANSNHEKHIKLLEKQLAELENKVMAPIRNDAAFLLRLSEIRQSEWEYEKPNQSNYHCHLWNKDNYPYTNYDARSKTQPNSTMRIRYYNMSYTLAVSQYQVTCFHSDFFKEDISKLDFLRYFSIFQVNIGGNYKSIHDLILKTRSGCITQEHEYYLFTNTKNTKIRLNVGKSPEDKFTLWLEFYFDNTFPTTFIELDDLTDKELIEKMYKKENLLE